MYVLIDVNYLETTAGAPVLTVSTLAKSGLILSIRVRMLFQCKMISVN